MNKELIEKVRRNFELNIYETKVWLALLSKGNANIANIHELSKVPRSRIYDVLKSLETKGFCVEKLGKPIKYIAVEPNVVVEKIKRDIEASSNEKIAILDKVTGSDEYKQLESLYKNTLNLTDKIGTSIKGRANLISHLANASSNATERIVLVSTPRGLERKLKVLMPILANRIKKGLKVTVGVSDSTDEKLSEMLLEKLRNANIKVKNIQGNGRFCIIDDNILLINSPEESKEDSALWIQSTFFAKTLSGLLKK